MGENYKLSEIEVKCKDCNFKDLLEFTRKNSASETISMSSLSKIISQHNTIHHGNAVFKVKAKVQKEG